jgi:hypothetical protein
MAESSVKSKRLPVFIHLVSARNYQAGFCSVTVPLYGTIPYLATALVAVLPMIKAVADGVFNAGPLSGSGSMGVPLIPIITPV